MGGAWETHLQRDMCTSQSQLHRSLSTLSLLYGGGYSDDIIIVVPHCGGDYTAVFDGKVARSYMHNMAETRNEITMPPLVTTSCCVQGCGSCKDGKKPSQSQ